MTIPLDLNITNIALISKGSTQVSMKDWRPIALCNVLYKIISKVLANRLKKVLSQCISDNVMVAIEVLHFMKTKTRGEKRYVTLKLDISKAYDRMDWEYLKAVMNKMGFYDPWMSWGKLSAAKVYGGMGFKDLSAFNLAMLGKQGWKFITEPDSLVARVFKARYFPSSSYLTTKIEHNPSYVWRNIMRAKFIVCGDARWRIGSCASIIF